MNDFQTVIEIGTTYVGPGYPCYVIAEAGSNHDGDINAAFDMIDAAADAGADAVKFQVFRPEDLVTRVARPASYLGGMMEGMTTLFELFATTAMDREWLPRLAERARTRDIDFLATPFDDDAVDRL